MAKSDLLKSIAVTAELMGTTLSKDAASVVCDDLTRFKESQVLDALERCRRECSPPLTIKKIIDRLDDGRPGVEEAWAMIPKNESETVVMTDEMAEAFGIASSLMSDGDLIAARVAFKEKYLTLVQQARNQGKPVRWFASLGHDPASRADVLKRAVELGRLSYAHVDKFLPPPEVSGDDVRRLIKPICEPMLVLSDKRDTGT